MKFVKTRTCFSLIPNWIYSMVFLLYVLFLVTSCGQKHTFSQDKKEQIVQEVIQTLENYAADVKAEGLMAEFRYLDSSAEFFWLPPGYSRILYFDSISDILKRSAADFAQIDNRFDSLKVYAISPDRACYTAWIHSVVEKHSGAVDSVNLLESGVLIKRDGHWKLYFGHTSLRP